MATKMKAKGVVIKYGDSATPTTTIPSLADVEITVGDRELIDVTTHDSDTAYDYIDSGLKDTVEISASVKLDPADTAHAWLRTKQNSGATVFITLVLPDTGNAEFSSSGIIRSLSISGPVKGALDASFIYKATGKETFTA